MPSGSRDGRTGWTRLCRPRGGSRAIFDCTVCTLHGKMAAQKKWAMLTPGEIELVKAEIKRLEKARQECNDSGLQKRIDAWIEELKKKLSDP